MFFTRFSSCFMFCIFLLIYLQPADITIVFSQVRQPLVNIDLDHVIIDELHLLLRVTDVLSHNILQDAMERDAREKCKNPLSGTHLKALVAAINQCGVSFNVWEKKNADGGGSGTYDWTSLMGSDKKKLLSHLPGKFKGILHDNTVDTVIKIWKVSAQKKKTNR